MPKQLEETIAFIKAHCPEGLIVGPNTYKAAIEAGIPAELLRKTERIPLSGSKLYKRIT